VNNPIKKKKKRKRKHKHKRYTEKEKFSLPTDVPDTQEEVSTTEPAPQVIEQHAPQSLDIEPTEVPQPIIQQTAPQSIDIEPTDVSYPGQNKEVENTDVPYPEQIVHTEVQSHKPYEILRDEINRPHESKEEFRKHQEEIYERNRVQD